LRDVGGRRRPIVRIPKKVEGLLALRSPGDAFDVARDGVRTGRAPPQVLARERPVISPESPEEEQAPCWAHERAGSSR